MCRNRKGKKLTQVKHGPNDLTLPCIASQIRYGEWDHPTDGYEATLLHQSLDVWQLP